MSGKRKRPSAGAKVTTPSDDGTRTSAKYALECQFDGCYELVKHRFFQHVRSKHGGKLSETDLKALLVRERRRAEERLQNLALHCQQVDLQQINDYFVGKLDKPQVLCVGEFLQSLGIRVNVEKPQTSVADPPTGADPAAAAVNEVRIDPSSEVDFPCTDDPGALQTSQRLADQSLSSVAQQENEHSSDSDGTSPIAGIRAILQERGLQERLDIDKQPLLAGYRQFLHDQQARTQRGHIGKSVKQRSQSYPNLKLKTADQTQINKASMVSHFIMSSKGLNCETDKLTTDILADAQPQIFAFLERYEVANPVAASVANYECACRKFVDFCTHSIDQPVETKQKLAALSAALSYRNTGTQALTRAQHSESRTAEETVSRPYGEAATVVFRREVMERIDRISRLSAEEISKKDFCYFSNYLLTRLSIRNGKRVDSIAKTTLRDLSMAKAEYAKHPEIRHELGLDVIPVFVRNTKTAPTMEVYFIDPAELALLEHYLVLREALANDSCEQAELFVSSSGNALSNPSENIQVWQKIVGVDQPFSVIELRDSAASAGFREILDAATSQNSPMSALMGHSQRINLVHYADKLSLAKLALDGYRMLRNAEESYLLLQNKAGVPHAAIAEASNHLLQQRLPSAISVRSNGRFSADFLAHLFSILPVNLDSELILRQDIPASIMQFCDLPENEFRRSVYDAWLYRLKGMRMDFVVDKVCSEHQTLNSASRLEVQEAVQQYLSGWATGLPSLKRTTNRVLEKLRHKPPAMTFSPNPADAKEPEQSGCQTTILFEDDDLSTPLDVDAEVEAGGFASADAHQNSIKMNVSEHGDARQPEQSLCQSPILFEDDVFSAPLDADTDDGASGTAAANATQDCLCMDMNDADFNNGNEACCSTASDIPQECLNLAANDPGATLVPPASMLDSELIWRSKTQSFPWLNVRDFLPRRRRGVFARVQIPAGSIVCDYRGSWLPASDHDPAFLAMDPQLRATVASYRLYVKSKDMYVLAHERPTGMTVYGRLINHTPRHPNVEPEYVELTNEFGQVKKMVIFRALRDIAKDEELLWTYGSAYSDQSWAFACYCPSCGGACHCDECRGQREHDYVSQGEPAASEPFDEESSQAYVSASLVPSPPLVGTRGMISFYVNKAGRLYLAPASEEHGSTAVTAIRRAMRQADPEFDEAKLMAAIHECGFDSAKLRFTFDDVQQLLVHLLVSTVLISRKSELATGHYVDVLTDGVPAEHIIALVFTESLQHWQYVTKVSTPGALSMRKLISEFKRQQSISLANRDCHP